VVDHQPAGPANRLGTSRQQVDTDKALLAGRWPGWERATPWDLAPDLAAAV
jgi:hypothetical protein